jgi:hypothetical protein
VLPDPDGLAGLEWWSEPAGVEEREREEGRIDFSSIREFIQ